MSWSDFVPAFESIFSFNVLGVSFKLFAQYSTSFDSNCSRNSLFKYSPSFVNSCWYCRKLLKNDSKMLRWMSYWTSESNAKEISHFAPSSFRQPALNMYHFGPATVTPRFISKLLNGFMMIDEKRDLWYLILLQKLIRNSPSFTLIASSWMRRLRQFCWKIIWNKLILELEPKCKFRMEKIVEC